jgi:hypothetical protein
VANGEDFSVEPMQTPCTHGPVDSTTRISERPGELPDRYDPVLAIRKDCQGAMWSG